MLPSQLMLPPTVQRDGHAFFFDLFISSLMQNTAADTSEGCARGRKSYRKLSVPEEDCQAGRETVCNRVLELEDFSVRANFPTSRRALSAWQTRLEVIPLAWYMDRGTWIQPCHDLFDMIRKLPGVEAESRIGYRGSFDANFGASMMSAKERIKMLAKKNRTMGLARKHACGLEKQPDMTTKSD